MFGTRQPGQRVTTQTTPTTEIDISLRQAAWASIALIGVAFAVQRVIVIPTGNALLAWQPTWRSVVIKLEIASGTLLVAGGAVLPWLALGISFVLQVFDINWPPPRQAQDASDGPNAPGVLRWLSGWREHKPELQAPAVNYAAPVASIAAPPLDNRVIDATIYVRNGKHTDVTHPALTHAQWRGLRRAVLTGSSISVRDLQRAGLKKGPARAINSALSEWDALLESRVGEHKSKRFCIAPFVEYLRDERYKTLEALPHPENSAPSV